MDDAMPPTSQPIKGSSIKSKILQSMEQLHNAKEEIENKSKKGGRQQPKMSGRTEDDVGINQFIDSSEGFTGIIKHRWGDFIVHEINLDGEVVTLTDTSVPVKKVEVKEKIVRPDWFSEELWEKIEKMHSSKKCGDSINIPAGKISKEQRTQYHVTIKGSFTSLVTNTSEEDGEKVIVVRKSKDSPDKQNTFWKHKPWPVDRPKFLHFCLFKENIDTFLALSNLSLDLKVKPNKFLFAGTKDARAKTTQMVSVKQITAEKIHETARKFSNKVAVGNFTYKDSGLRLGDLRGNQFDLILRHVQGSGDVISRRMTSFESLGFINYFGLQRFGTSSTGTHDVGRAILRREWRRAIDLVLSGRENESGSIPDAQRAWRTDRDPRRALSYLSNKQQRTSIEGRVLHSLSVIRPTAFQEAMDRLPAGTRQLYVHAYQSWLWNKVASRRLAKHGLKLRVGDLVLTGDQTPAEDEMPPEDTGDAEAEPNAESGSKEDGGGHSGGHDPYLPRLPDVRVVTEENIASYSIYDLVLPLPGWAVRYPENETASWFTELLSADNIQLTRELGDSMPQYSLAGAYRYVLIKPGKVSWRLLRYADPTADLIASDLDRLRGREPEPDRPGAPFRALLMQFSLPSSSYATMALREITGSDTGLTAQMELNAAYSEEMRRVRNEAASEAKKEMWAEKTSADKEGKQEAAGDTADTDAEEEKAVKVEQGETGDEGLKGTEEGHGLKRGAEDGEKVDEKRLKTEEAA